MRRAGLKGWRPCRRHRQRGQALIYGMFVVIGGLAALFFLFNAGQLSQEKTKLVNAADAAAYSAGVMHARALNFDAYGNRALVANEVLVAQMVSVSSWAQYAKTHAENLPGQFPECYAPYSYPAWVAAGVHYGPLYLGMCSMTVLYTGEYIQQIAARVPPLAQAAVTAVEVNKRAIQLAQNLLHAPQYLQSMRTAVLQDVAQANYAGDGTVRVESAGLGSATGLTDDWQGFSKKYSGQDRGRMAEVASTAAYTDEFTRERSWDAVPPDYSCPGRKSEVRRRGGTELVNYDEWIAQDTESFWYSYLTWRGCRKQENPIAYGEQQAHPKGRDQDDSSAWLGGARTNPRASAMASSDDWTNYSGLPGFYELSQQQLDKDDPTLRFSVRLVRARADLRTSDGSSQIRTTKDSRINAYDSTVANGEMAAVATSEVYFERPFDQRQNRYGAARGRAQEIGSLFNPYWQVRLVYSESDVRSQQQRQGALIE